MWFESKYRRRWFAGLGGLCGVALAGRVIAQPLCLTPADQAKATALYEQAHARQGAPEAVPWLKESITLCPTFQNYAELAYTLLSLERYAEAQEAAQEAVKRAASPDHTVMGWWLMAQSLEGQDRWADAKLAYDNASYQLKGPAPRWLVDSVVVFEDALAKRGGLQSRELTQALRSTRAPGAVPRIALRIEFDYDSATLAPAGRAQIRELAVALMAIGTRDDRVRLVGHTDERGAPAYNRELSERRARAVAVELARMEPALAPRLTTEGRGAETPRAPNAQTESQHAINRRVEVELGAPR